MHEIDLSAELDPEDIEAVGCVHEATWTRSTTM
jgi:hypothetical protein